MNQEIKKSDYGIKWIQIDIKGTRMEKLPNIRTEVQEFRSVIYRTVYIYIYLYKT